jgi:hypothetical protein
MRDRLMTPPAALSPGGDSPLPKRKSAKVPRLKLPQIALTSEGGATSSRGSRGVMGSNGLMHMAPWVAQPPPPPLMSSSQGTDKKQIAARDRLTAKGRAALAVKVAGHSSLAGQGGKIGPLNALSSAAISLEQTLTNMEIEARGAGGSAGGEDSFKRVQFPKDM